MTTAEEPELHPAVIHYQLAIKHRNDAWRAEPGSDAERMHTEHALVEATLSCAKVLETMVISAHHTRVMRSALRARHMAPPKSRRAA